MWLLTLCDTTGNDLGIELFSSKNDAIDTCGAWGGGSYIKDVSDWDVPNTLPSDDTDSKVPAWILSFIDGKGRALGYESFVSKTDAINARKSWYGNCLIKDLTNGSIELV